VLASQIHFIIWRNFIHPLPASKKIQSFLKYLGIFILFSWNFLHAQLPVGKEVQIDNGLPSNTVRSMYMDNAGTIFLGTESGIQILPENQSNNRNITQTIGRAQVWAIVPFNDWIYIGTYDSGLYIFNKTTNVLYKRYSAKELPRIRRIRILNNKVIGIYAEGVFELKSLQLIKSFQSPKENNKPLIPIDVFYWKSKICVAHYSKNPAIFIQTEDQNWLSAPKQFLPSNLWSSTHIPLVYFQTHGRLFVGFTHNRYTVIRPDNSVENFDFQSDASSSNFQVWDIAADNHFVYLGVGNHQNFNKGFIW
jgi:hypothetical protein